MSTLLVVEDHPLVREGMMAALSRLRRGVEVLQAQDAESALRCLEQDSDLDLVLLDLLLPGMDGFAFLGVLRHRFPALPVVVVSALGDDRTIRRVASLGASGFVHKSNGSDALLDAVRVVLDGGVYFAQPTGDVDVLTALDERRDAVSDFGLSAAQARVLDLLSQGMSNREIGDRLGLTEGTVKGHLFAIYRALNVSSRAQAMVAMRRRH